MENGLEKLIYEMSDAEKVAVVVEIMKSINMKNVEHDDVCGIIDVLYEKVWNSGGEGTISGTC